ncbi:hypothetical protein BSL78_09200 [Apostichopus japonicus]|uniref:Uncharacterized protein n=1 Tax=Stichopus japonicus TaxID=307972 RepID=A0A2G8L0Y6_STIJA|nr:hypothetical protein BSL78_09200 [Apostichopus japonicus]
MGEIVQNTSLFEILDDPKFRLEAVSEASSEVSQLPIDPNRDTGLVLIVDQKSSKGVKKVRNNPKNKRQRKLPNLSSSPGFGRREETRESLSSTNSPTPIRNGIANGGGHGVSETKSTDHVRADLSGTDGTTGEGKNENRFQSKAQIFEQGEGAALLRRGIKKNLAKKKGIRRKLPSLPEQFMDIIEQVREANKTPFADVDEENIDTLTESSERSSSLETEQKLHDDEEHLDKFRILTPITEDIENEKEDGILSFDESKTLTTSTNLTQMEQK